MSHERIRMFGQQLLEALELDLGRPIAIDDRFHEDWNFDSLQMVVLLLTIETLAESVTQLGTRPMMANDEPEIATVEDAFNYFTQLVDHARPSKP